MLYTCARDLSDKRCCQTFIKTGGKKHTITRAIAPFPAQSFAQRHCLRFRARQANPNSNLGAQCAHGPPNNIGARVPCDPRTVCQTPKTRGCPMIRARPAKLDSNLGAQCAQGLPNSVDTQVPYVLCRACQTPKKRRGPQSTQGPPNSVATRVPAESNITWQRVWPTKTRCNSRRNN